MVIEDAFGSPDIRQIDGLGGADVLTSKVAIVSKRERFSGSNANSKHCGIHGGTTDGIVADVDYLFGQVEFGCSSNPCDNDDENCDGADSDGTATVGVSPRILYDVNCGNISAGVGPYAIEEGLIEPTDDTVTPVHVDVDDGDGIHNQKYKQTVRIYNVNTGKVIVSEVPVEKVVVKHDEEDEDSDTNEDYAYWTVVEDGDYGIDGVPGTSACLPLDFSNCTGTLGNKKGDGSDGNGRGNRGRSSMLLPTGNARDTVVVDECSYDVSLLDVANFVVHVDGRQLGLNGTEPSTKILSDEELWNKVRKIRHEAARLVMEEDDITPTKPFTSVVFPFLSDHGYESIRGDLIGNREDGETLPPEEDSNDSTGTTSLNASIDFRAFVLFCDHPHKAYPGTASNATAAAALIDGTVVSDVMNKHVESVTRVTEPNKRNREKVVSIGHPSGQMLVSSEIEEVVASSSSPPHKRNEDDHGTVATNEYVLKRSVIGRTSRRIADGRLYLKPNTIRRLNEET